MKNDKQRKETFLCSRIITDGKKKLNKTYFFEYEYKMRQKTQCTKEFKQWCFLKMLLTENKKEELFYKHLCTRN